MMEIFMIIKSVAGVFVLLGLFGAYKYYFGDEI